MDIGRRIETVRERLRVSTHDALLVSKTSNVVYLTGMTGVFDAHADVACILSEDGARIFTGFIYAEAARAAAAADDIDWEIVQVDGDLYETVCKRLSAEGTSSIAMESSVPYGRFRFVSEHCSGKIEVVDQWVEDVRVIKEPGEISLLEDAARLADQAFEHILGVLTVGMTENEVALQLEVYLRRNGSEGVAFAPIVASGPNSSNPHAQAGDRRLAAGELVKMDFGARVGGYCSDLTRTVVLGSADERMKEMHAAVLEANEAGTAAVRPGRSAKEIDAAARESLAARGFVKEFGHGLGHGVGLDVHESPRVGKTSDAIVPRGAVITIEPGVYVPGFGGVRIEDLVTVEAEGARVLSAASRELLEI